jgi:hypothetical protein
MHIFVEVSLKPSRSKKSVGASLALARGLSSFLPNGVFPAAAPYRKKSPPTVQQSVGAPDASRLAGSALRWVHTCAPHRLGHSHRQAERAGAAGSQRG